MNAHRASAVLIAALCLVISACGSDSEPATSESTSESTVPPSVATTTAPEGGTTGPVDAVQAIDFAIANTPGDAVEIEAKTEHDVAVWEVIVLQADGTAVEYLVSIATGQILEQKPANVAVTSAPAVSLVQAIEIATSAVPDSAIVEARLETERGQVVWDVLVRQIGSGGEVELEIDAETGEIVRQEVDD